VISYRTPIDNIKSSKVTLILLIMLFTCAIGLITGLGYYSILVILLFCSIVFAIFMFRAEYLLYYYLVLGALTFPGALDRIGGLVTLNWVRTAFLAILYLLYSLVFAQNIREVVKSRESKRFLLAIFPWIGYLGITILWAISPVDSMRYYPKLLMAAFLALSLLLDRRIPSTKCFKMLIIGAIIFLVVSTIAIPFAKALWPGNPPDYFRGYSGRHASKFYVLFIAILALSMWLVNKRKKLSIFMLIYSFIMLIWILQRGAILALVLGGLTVFLLTIRKAPFSLITKGMLSLGLIILGIYVLFYTPSFQESMFKPHYGPNQFFGYMLKGDVSSAVHSIDFKGRFEQWEVAKELQESFLGKGFGTTPVYIKRISGQYFELHNDVLQYRIETGYIGFVLYLFMWISIFSLGWKFRHSDDKILRILCLALCGYTVALFSWSFVEHVFDYSHMSGAYMFILAALVVKRVMENTRSAGVKQTPDDGVWTSTTSTAIMLAFKQL